MTFYSIFLIGLALSLDAFGVALCIGLNKNVNVRYKMLCSLSFSFFQFLFSFIGAYAGFLFNTYIASMPQIIGGIVISIVGVLMIKEGMDNKDECALVKPGMWAILGISVSIDALVVGFTALNNISNKISMLNNTLIIGLITLVNTILAFFITKYLKRIELIGKYADYIGGIILVLFGIKMMFF
ncbi:manganese efflux pump MntP family protein [Clostridium sp. MSJ-11]|uniref:Manganese efflux pump MntP family protein n=1 Tax=Clostridium mobile TaxID=2841512 RepID=A0ABS6EMV9_9CLOT|nr:manganese efflux pump [Clostridium mobile]MBU5485709.1 manganese efflux pump MntP family protein [Clostridium mobile]